MLNVTDETKAIFKSDAAAKQLIIRIPDADITLTNEDIITESMTLTESIEADDNLTFTGCIASCFSFECFDFATDVNGMAIEADLQADGAELIPLFRGYIDEVTNLTHEDYTRKITAYDALYKINNADVTSWWNGLTFPITIANLRNSFFSYLGITQVADYLSNDPMPVYNNIDDEVISGATIIKNICQINGRFGQMNRYGQFVYRHLIPGTEALYPNDTLYPEDTLYPADENALDSVSKAHYMSISYENYEVQPITGVQLIGINDDVVASSGTSTNIFTVSDNEFVYGLDSSTLSGVATNLLNTIKNLWYIPSDIECVGLPYVECGDFVMCATRRSIIRTYVINRTLTGIQVLNDTYENDGDYKQPVYVSSYESTTTASVTAETTRATTAESSLSSDIATETSARETAISNTNATIQTTATEIRSEVKSADNQLSSKITQTASEIRSEVSDTASGLSSRITQNANSITAQAQTITLQAQTINLKADKTYVDNLIATRATISQLNATNARIESVASNRSFSGTIYTDAISVGGRTFSTAKTINTFNSAGKYLGQITVLATG